MDRKRRWERRKAAEGLCIRCGYVPVCRDSKIYCILCLDKHREHDRRRRRKLIARGICPRCGAEPSVGTPTKDCIECAERNRAKVARWHKERKESRCSD